MGVTYNPLLKAGFDQTGSGGAGTPAGSDTQLQFNDGGAFGGDSGLLFDKTTNKLTAAGDIELNDGGSFTTTIQTVTPTANRTLSFPDATGTLALVGGSSTQVLYNASGALAGISTLTFDGTTLTTAGRFVNSYTSLASSPAKAFTGTWFTGGSATTTKPHLLIEPAGTTSTAWSTSGTGFGVNAASGFAGNLLDLQVNGARAFGVSASGGVRIDGTGGQFSEVNHVNNDGILLKFNGSNVIQANTVGVAIRSTAALAWSPTGVTWNADLAVGRDAANTLAQRNGTNAQTFRLYNTLTGTDVGATGNYERGFLRWNTNVLEVGTEVGSGGGTVRPVRITAATLKLPNLPTYADNAAALGGGLVAGDVYKTATGELRITV
jgi:hypothetical protein